MERLACTASLFILISASSLCYALNHLACNTSTLSSCSGYLYLHGGSQSSGEVANLFGVNVSKVYQSSQALDDYIIVVDCACQPSPSLIFSTAVTYHVQYNDTGLEQISSAYFNNLVYITASSNTISRGEVIHLPLVCGCAGQMWQYVLSYEVVSGDVLHELAQNFFSTVDQISELNHLIDPNSIFPGQVLFIPTNTNPASAMLHDQPIPSATQTKGIPIAGIAAGTAGAIILLGALTVTCFYYCWRKNKEVNAKASVNYLESLPSFQKGSGGSSLLPFTSGKRSGSGSINGKKGSESISVFSLCTSNCSGPRSSGDILNMGSQLSKEAVSLLGIEKPVMFDYKDIVIATNDFDASKKIGQGAYGSVYHGTLCNQNVAIKQMKATKSKEFMAELKVLCKVHHTNLVELIGYSCGEDDLYLVYEFVENGALSDHLHDPGNKGHQILPWTVRVQIAVDAATGLEYIHEHTKLHCVHRDIKTGNILLDAVLRAKIADFGLAKFVECVGDEGSAPTRVVGTFGYLAPEYIRDGIVTLKTDVYAFGVVLMELITGKQALLKPQNSASPCTAERRLLISSMLLVFQDKYPREALKKYIDPKLEGSYPFGSVFEMAELAKACVEEDPSLRPDMKQIAFNLSRILFSSIEWEASLAGNSQIFSGLVQGR